MVKKLKSLTLVTILVFGFLLSGALFLADGLVFAADQQRDRLQDGSCDNDCDGTPDQDRLRIQYGSCNNECDGTPDQDQDRLRLQDGSYEDCDQDRLLTRQRLRDQSCLIEDLAEQLEEAIEENNTEVISDLELKRELAELQLNNISQYLKELKLERKDLNKNNYSQDELNQLQERIRYIERFQPGMIALPPENIISNGRNFKFDTPPVIRESRVLIPVRAITEAFGAEVIWDSEKKTVTITKEVEDELDELEEIVILFDLVNDKVFINGEEQEIDISADNLNERVIVPLRFIAETLGLGVDFDQELNIIDIFEE